MNRYFAENAQTRVVGAIAAAVASTLMIGSVLWLFTDNGTVSASSAPVQILASGGDAPGASRIRAR